MNREQQIIEIAIQQARKLRKVHGPAHVIALSTYASDADLRQLRPEDGPTATVAQQRRIVDAVATALRSEGYLVRLVELKVVHYLAYLSSSGLANTAANRAAWISNQIRS